ncbi:MAG: MBL fold metallo-hydrolase [Acidobacteria bacterium]|nr:MBL fold metallo-hydrolase [Acidobacteriota bacterium]
MPDLLDLSARFIDGDSATDADLGPTNRINLELSEIADGIAMVESFSHVVAFATDEGTVLFDGTLEALAPTAFARIRDWNPAPFHTLVYTHGHIDHVGGGKVLQREAAERGEPAPRIVAHEAVPERFERYRLTNGYNAFINHRQFKRSGVMGTGADGGPAFPRRFAEPDVTYQDALSLSVGDVAFELHHSRGETDDHTWAWVPSHRAACLGDLLIWSFPNAGNPQKVQRFPQDWARALRDIAAMQPELLLPAHGLPIGGAERVQRVLGETAEALEHLVDTTLAMMNAGATLDAIIHTVKVPEALLDRPYLKPVYDEPEFVVRNIWRFYGGWYDGNPARLKPAADAEVATEVAALAGGVAALVARAQTLADATPRRDGRPDPEALRLACQLVEWALGAAPEDPAARAAAREIYALRRDSERSLMAKGIYGEAAERG